MASACRTFCSTRSTVRWSWRAMSRMVSMMRSTSSGARPSDGSASRMRRGDLRVGDAEGAELQIVGDGEVREDEALRRNEGQAAPDAGGAGGLPDGLAVEDDPAGPQRQQPGDGLEARRLSRAVVAHEGHDPPGLDPQVDAEDDLLSRVARRQPLDREEAHRRAFPK